MATLLHRLGRWCATHGWRVVAFWLAALIGLGALAGAVGTPATNVVKFPNAQFQDVMTHLEDRLPEVDGTMGTAVFTTESGKPFTRAQKAAIREVIGEWEQSEHVTTVVDPFSTQQQLNDSRTRLEDGRTQLRKGQRELLVGTMELDRGRKFLTLGEEALADAERTDPTSAHTADLRRQVEDGRKQIAEGQAQVDRGRTQIEKARLRLERGQGLLDSAQGVRFVSEDGNAAVTQIGFDMDPQSVAQEEREHLVEMAAPLADEGVQASFGAEITQESSVVGIGEIIGLATAAVVLLVMLGSLIAAGLPLLNALFGVGVGITAAVAASYFFEMHMMTPALALMLGLAVGIDYLLFIINRHRTQLQRGMDVTDSIALAVGTAGNAVVFAGATVFVALAALVVSGVPVLAQMGLVAAGTVVAAILMSITLGPAVLGLVGRRVMSRRAWRAVERRRADRSVSTDDHSGDEAHGGWYVRLITAKPWLTILAVVGIVALIALPARELRLGLPDGSSEDPGSSAYTAYTTIADEFGPGMNGPLVAVVDLEGQQTKGTAEIAQARLAENLVAFPGVDSVVPIGMSQDHRTLAYQIVLDTGPTEAATDETVQAMLTQVPDIERANDVEIGMTGRTVANLEISERLSAALPPYLAIVVGLSLLILLAVFRSVVVPLIATGGFLLSVAAAFGALVAVYQWGWLGSVFGVHEPGPLMSFGPIMIIGVLFGLAMDYQMFLVSGMREAHAHGEDARTAVRSGFVHGAKVVTAAAAIMFAVFGGFVWSHMVMVRPLGFGLAIGVLVDAVLIRMTLTPAVMHLLGDRAWWLPAWLDRILPDLDVEGTTLAARLAQEEQRGRASQRELAGV